MNIPTFGSRSPDAHYIVRRGAYAIVRKKSDDSEAFIAACPGPGGLYLPGGGIKEGESEEEALRREIREECETEIRILGLVGMAADYIYASSEGRYFQKIGTFYRAEFAKPPSAKQTVWISLTIAGAAFRQEGHWWAVGQAETFLRRHEKS